MNAVRKLGLMVISLMFLTAFANTISAQETHTQKVETLRAEKQQPWSTPGWGAGLGAGMVIIGAGLGFGRIGGAALESMARQPETAGRVQTAMIIIGALLEGATFFALIVCMQIGGKA